MANRTVADHHSLVVYEVFVRNHGRHGSLAEVEADLARIRALGADVVWLMPIHPVGELGRKGKAGSPYSVRHYHRVDPNYGALRDFSALLDTAHGLGLKVMMDVVFNHAARDCPLVHEHPDWFDGAPGGRNALPDWTDVLPFNHDIKEIWEYLIDVLSYWAGLGVDGFRCDVACFLPLDFWLEARRQLDTRHPRLIWLAESADFAYVAERRNAGLPVLSDNELYQAFDITYDHDTLPVWRAVLRGQAPLERYAEFLRIQDAVYPAGSVKLRTVENHDQPRIMALAPTKEQALAWTAFQAFNKGAFLIYAGQEAGARRSPSLFEKDPIDWSGYPLQPFLARLAALKKDPIAGNGTFVITAARQTLQAAWQSAQGTLYGVFDVQGNGAACRLPLPDADYEDVLNQTTVAVRRGACLLAQSAAVLRWAEAPRLQPFRSPALDHAEASAHDHAGGASHG